MYNFYWLNLVLSTQQSWLAKPNYTYKNLVGKYDLCGLNQSVNLEHYILLPMTMKFGCFFKKNIKNKEAPSTSNKKYIH